MFIIKTMYVERNMQMSSDLVTNQISLLNSYPNPAHRKYERFSRTIRIGLKYLSTSSVSLSEKKDQTGVQYVTMLVTVKHQSIKLASHKSYEIKKYK